MMKEKKSTYLLVSFELLLLYTSICRNPTVVSGDSKRRRRYASQGHRAKSLSNMGGKEIPGKDTNTLFCVCTFIIVVIPPPTLPAISCWFPAKHVCRALYALSSLACRCLPRFDAAAVTCQQWVGAAAFFCSSHAANPEIADVCVRGYQPGLTPAKHCEGKRFS